MSTRSRPAHASMAAEPVSPEVAPTIVTRLSRCGQHMIEQAPEHLHRQVLEGQRRTVEQFLHEQPGLKLDQRHDGGMAEPGISLAADRRSTSNGIDAPTNGCMTRAARSA